MMVGQRPDMPAHSFRMLLSRATDAVQSKLLASVGPDRQAEIRRVLAKISGEIGRDISLVRDFESSKHQVSLMEREGRLNEAEVYQLAVAKRFEDTVAALAALWAMPIEIVDQLMHAQRADVLLIPCKAAGFSWPSVRAIVKLQVRKRELSDESMDRARSDFGKLSKGAAEYVMRFRRTHRLDDHQT